MKIAVTCVGGAVPVKRAGELHVSTLPADVRRILLEALAAARAAAPAGDHDTPPPPDVGGCTVSVEEASGARWELSFSDASATQEQSALLKLLRPYLKVVPWR